jgi:hypothetical protein
MLVEVAAGLTCAHLARCESVLPFSSFSESTVLFRLRYPFLLIDKILEHVPGESAVRTHSQKTSCILAHAA